MKWIREHAATISAITAVVAFLFLSTGQLREWWVFFTRQAFESLPASGPERRQPAALPEPAAAPPAQPPTKVEPQPKSNATPSIPKLSKAALRRLIFESIAVFYDVPLSTIHEGMEFSRDFPPDRHGPMMGDLRLIELVMRVETFARCDIPDDVVMAMHTVGDVIALANPRCAD